MTALGGGASSGGTGLGLAISARLAATMGDHIAVRSPLGQGSSLSLFLPIDTSAGLAQDALSPEDERPRASLGA